MNKQQVGLKRNTIDKYYTNENAVNYCFELIKQNLDIDYENDIVIEPSAGNGSFIKIIKQLSKNNLFIDLKPENDEIKQQDYLNLDVSFKSKYKKMSETVDIIIIRLNNSCNNINLKNSRPCNRCIEILQEYNIRRVYYSNEMGEIICENLKEMLKIHISSGYRYRNKIKYT